MGENEQNVRPVAVSMLIRTISDAELYMPSEPGEGIICKVEGTVSVPDGFNLAQLVVKNFPTATGSLPADWINQTLLSGQAVTPDPTTGDWCIHRLLTNLARCGNANTVGMVARLVQMGPPYSISIVSITREHTPACKADCSNFSCP